MHIDTSIADATRSDVVRFLADIQTREGRHPLSEYKEMRVGHDRDVIEHLMVTGAGSITGYGQAAWHRPVNGSTGHWAIEIVAVPGPRQTDVAARLIESLREQLGDASMTLWARTRYVVDAARAGGWSPNRTLRKMVRALPMDCARDIPRGIIIDTFRPGVDEGAWLEANNRAFAGHPENGALELDDIEHREQADWFDPRGFFVAWDGDKVAGSCWTKVHDDETGEIYIIGIIPEWSGRGLGRALLCMGLDYLGNVRGAGRGMLYVESDNERARRLYDDLGFIVAEEITAFVLD